ncbi:hypothetical protein TPB0596_32420 [Tsukamurella pulmonis]|nr:hypothetical protein TPB0596_32420 [Tsukamurella pulmonis]
MEHRVTVSEVLKGASVVRVGETVSVWQQGGLTPDQKVKVVVGNDEIAEPEQTILFSVTQGAANRFELVPVYGDIPLFTDEPANTSMLQRMRQAVESEVPYKGGP